MLDDDQREVLPTQVDENVRELFHVAAAEARRRLIQQQHLRARSIRQRD